jgi:hypothetical protein
MARPVGFQGNFGDCFSENVLGQNNIFGEVLHDHLQGYMILGDVPTVIV